MHLTEKGDKIFRVAVQAIGITLLAFCLAAVLMQPFSLSVATLISSNDRTDFNITDFYNIVADSRHVRTLDPDIVLIDIADGTRDDIADLLDAIPAFEPRAVGLDVAFEEKRAGDEYLLAAIEANPNMVMLTEVLPPSGAKALNVDEFVLGKASYFLPDSSGRVLAAPNLPTKIPGGVVRNFRVDYPIAGDSSAIPSFPVAVAQLADSQAVADLRARGNVLETIYYPSRTFRSVRYDHIADNPEILRGKILLIGALNDEADLHATPPQIRMSGVEIHAYALSTILNREYLGSLPSMANYLIAFLLCFMLALTLLLLPTSYKSLVLRFIQVAVLYCILRIGYYCFIDHRTVVDFSYSLLMLTFVLFACDIWLGLGAIAKKILNRNQTTQKN